MNVGFINNFGNYPPKGGSSLHVYQQIKKFVEYGHKVHSFFGDYPYDLFVKYNKGELRKFIKNIDVLYLRLGGGISQDILSLLKYLSKKNIPLVWEVNAPAREREGFKKYLVEFIWKMLSTHVDAAICVSNIMDEYVRKTLAIKNSRVIPNGSDPKLFNPGKANRRLFVDIKEDDFAVLWAGRAEFPWQGIDIIFEVASKMQDINKNIKFVLVTNPDDITHPLLGNMNIVNKVPYLEVGRYIASADICLCLYKMNEAHKNGFYPSPLKLFDYMSCAKPVIASSLGQINEVVKDGINGYLTNNNVDDIVNKIQFLYDNRDQCCKVGQSARNEIIRYYNWDRVAKETLDFFEDSIKRKQNKC